MEKEINSAISTISHIHAITADFLRQRLSEKKFPDLVSSHGNILFQLSKEDSLPMLELAKRINRNKSTTTVLVRKLEKLGFVKIETSKEDVRKRLISLTPIAKKYNEQTQTISNELLERFYTGFSETEKKQLCKLLRKISDNFEKLE